MNYTSRLFDLRQTEEFSLWIAQLRDRRAKVRILGRIARFQAGLLGDAKYFDGIGEMRVDTGPGYRLYFFRRGETIIILLCWGDKSSQSRDMARAKAMAQEV